MRIDRTFCQARARIDFLPFLYRDVRAKRNQITLRPPIISSYNHMAVFLNIFKGNRTAEFADNCQMLWLASLKQFFNTRKALCNIFSICNAAGMESTHRQLRARFTNGLRCNGSHCFTDRYFCTGSKIQSIALLAHTIFGLAAEDGADFNAFDTVVHNNVRICIGHQLVLADQHFPSLVIHEIFCKVAANQPLMQRFNDFAAFLNIVNFKSICCATVILTDNNILRNIDQAACQISGIRCTQSCICQAFTGTARRNEVFQNVQALTVIRTDWNFNGFTGSIGNQSTHTCQLTNLAHGTTGAGIRHHKDRVIPVKVLLQCIRNLICCLVPCTDNCRVPLSIRQETIFVLVGNRVNALVRFLQDFFLLRRNRRITNSNGNTG